MAVKVSRGCLAIFHPATELRSWRWVRKCTFYTIFRRTMARYCAAVDKYEGEQPSAGVGVDESLFVTRGRAPIPGSAVQAAFDQRQRIRDALQAFTQIAQNMKVEPGQKNLLWVSGVVPTQFAAVVNGVPASEDFHKEVAVAMRELGAANVVLTPVIPSGVKVISSDSMMEMAEQTGGTVFAGSNDVSALARAAMDDMREGYVLTFVPKDYREDGSLHNLRLTTSRRGVELRYRPGYVADPPAAH
jgi:VWFA-related protein